MAAAFCENHTFELAEDLCGTCGRAYCAECIVYAFGPKKPPICKGCALARAGIRKHAGPTRATSRRELRRLSRERRREARAAKKDRAAPAQMISSSMDWDAIEDDPSRPVAEPYVDSPASVGAGSAAVGFDVDPSQLREVRPSYDGPLPRR